MLQPAQCKECIYDAAVNDNLIERAIVDNPCTPRPPNVLERATLRFYCRYRSSVEAAILLKIRESLKTRTDHIGEWLDGSQWQNADCKYEE